MTFENGLSLVAIACPKVIQVGAATAVSLVFISKIAAPSECTFEVSIKGIKLAVYRGKFCAESILLRIL